MENFFFFINFIYENLENNYLIFFIIYFLSLTIFFSFSLPGGPLLLIVSSFFFGFYLGCLINFFAMLIGSLLFVYFIKNIFKKFFNETYQNISIKFTNLIKQSSYEYLIIFRLIQGNPLFIQNLAFSFINITSLKFLISSFIGFSPAIIMFSYFGSKISKIYDLKNISYNEIISKDFIILIIILILFLFLRIILRTKKFQSFIKKKNL